MGITWQVDITKAADDIEDELHGKYVGFIADCINNVIALSPVDTGRYKGAHHISTGSPSYAMSGAQWVNIPKGEFATVFIQNNLPYCERLENGHSQQAPTGVYGNAFNSALANLG